MLIVLILLLILPVLSYASNPGPEAPGKIIDVNDISVHLNCVGQGAPVVVLEAGLGGNSLEWHPVQNLLSRSTRVCSYDRPGYGWSEISGTPRNALTISSELNDLLDASGESPPYLLVGHSFGGHIVRLFANKYRDRVAGIMLVDASHERLFDLLRGGRSRMLVTIKAPPTYHPQTPDSLPESIKPVFSFLAKRPESRVTVQNETFYFERSAEEVMWFPELPSVPIMIMSRNQGRDSVQATAREDNKSNHIGNSWAALQQDLHKRLANLEHVIASGSGHFPHLDQPALVTAKLIEMIERIKSGNPRHFGQQGTLN